VAQVAPNPRPAPEDQHLPVPVHRPVAEAGEFTIARSAEDIVANVINRQLIDDLENPPQGVEVDSEITSLREVFKAIEDGRSIAELTPLIAQATSGQEQLDQLVHMHYRRYRAKQLVTWMENDAFMNKFLQRVFRRGDFTPAEALVFKRMSQTTVKDLAEQILGELREGAPMVSPEEAATRIDYNLYATTRQVLTEKTFQKMTPQGREIVRKLVFRARTRIHHTETTVEQTEEEKK
jgi:hypothetical protein